jgi:hypothetical protein
VSALLADGDRGLIAKFSSTTDVRPVVKAEGVAMELARRVGLNSASVESVSVASKDRAAGPEVRTQWDEAADAARLTELDRQLLYGREILNAFAFRD